MILTSIVTAAVVAKLSSAGIIKEPAFMKSMRRSRPESQKNSDSSE